MNILLVKYLRALLLRNNFTTTNKQTRE